MKIEYRDVATQKLLDVITLTGNSAAYTTGKAKDMVERVTKGPGGYRLALAKFKSWSNGYVVTTEKPV